MLYVSMHDVMYTCVCAFALWYGVGFVRWYGWIEFTQTNEINIYLICLFHCRDEIWSGNSVCERISLIGIWFDTYFTKNYISMEWLRGTDWHTHIARNRQREQKIDKKKHTQHIKRNAWNSITNRYSVLSFNTKNAHAFTRRFINGMNSTNCYESTRCWNQYCDCGMFNVKCLNIFNKTFWPKWPCWRCMRVENLCFLCIEWNEMIYFCFFK